MEGMVELLRAAYDATTAVAAGLEDDGFARPTRATGWTVRDLLFHQLCDAQRALIALASPARADEAPDVDAVSYWVPWQPGSEGADRHAAYVRRAAAAYSEPRSLVEQWRATSGAVVRAVADSLARGAGPVRTQGHVIRVADLASTLVVEATVHLLDLTLEVPGAPDAGCLAHTRGVLDGLLGSPLPAAWGDTEAALKGTGREALTDADRSVLGPLARHLPLLG